MVQGDEWDMLDTLICYNIMQSVFSPAARRRSLVASTNAERRGR